MSFAIGKDELLFALSTAQASVVEFHAKFGQPIGDLPKFSRPGLRAHLIMEEAIEAVAAIVGEEEAVWCAVQEFQKREDKNQKPSMAEAADGLCDLIYVALGAAVEFGIDLAPLFEEVHRSNLTKTPGVAREDGKILKGPDFEPPRIAELLMEQGWTGK